MIFGAFCMIAANAATLLGAHALQDRIRFGRTSVDLVLFLLLRFLIISVVVLLAGLTRQFTPVVLGVTGLLALGGLAATGAHRRLPRWRSPSWGPVWTLLAAAVGIRLLLQAWFLAPYLGDSLSYHLPKIAEWVRAGGFNGELGIDTRSTFPAGFEVIEAWWVVFLHHDVLIELAGIEFLLLAVASVYAIADGLGWGPRASVAAAALFLLNPSAHFQATSCTNDGPVTALILGTVALIVAGSPPLLLLLPAMLGVGVKPTFLYALPGLVLIAALLPRPPDASPRTPRILAALASAAVLVGAFWYLRNWAVYGNPIHPVGAGGIKSPLSGATLQRLGPNLKSLIENLTCFLDIRIYDGQQAPNALCTAGYGWGPAGFAGALALIPVLREERLLRRIALGLVLSALCLFMLVELDLFYCRFVVFLAALPALALGRIWERHRMVAVLGSLAILLQFLETLVPGNFPAEDLKRVVRQDWRERCGVAPPPDRPTGRVGFAWDGLGNAYPLYGPAYSREVVYLRDRTPDELIAHIDREALQVIYGTVLMESEWGFAELVRRGRLRPVVHGSWAGFEVLPRP